MQTSLCGTIRKFKFPPVCGIQLLANNCRYSNDAAIEKAQSLAKTHGVKTNSYKVDGECIRVILYVRIANLISLPVSDPANVQNAIAEVAKDFGKIDVFIANAGKLIVSVCIFRH